VKRSRKNQNKSNLKYICPGRAVICFLLLLAVSPVLAGNEMGNTPLNGETRTIDTLRVSLQEAIFLGLKNNPTLSIQRRNPDIMSTFAREQLSAFDPLLIVTGIRNQASSTRRLGAQRTPFTLDDKGFETGLQFNELFPTGTSIIANIGMTGSVSSLYADQYTGGMDVTITQSLLQGFGFGANLAGVRKARLDVEISKSELKAVAENLTAEIENGYWDLYLTGQEMQIQQQSLELAQKQLSESQERVAVGKLPRLELAAVEAEVAARRSALIDAQSQHEQSRLRFLYLLNPESNKFWETLPKPVDRPFLPNDSLEDIIVHEKVGLKYRPDLEQARFNLKKGDLEIARTKNGLLPRLDLFVTLGRTNYAETFAGAYPDFNSPFYQMSAGLSIALPVPNRQASAQLQRARFSREQQAQAVENMEKLVQWDVRSAYVEVLRSRQQIEATRVTRELQAKKLDAEQEKFRVGKSTNFLVLQAQRDYTASQLDEARSMVAYLNALVKLYVAEGTLLERRGIKTLDY